MKEIASLTLVCAVVWNVAVGLNENLDMVSPTGFPLFKLSFSSPGPFLSLSLSLSLSPLSLLSSLPLASLSLSLSLSLTLSHSLTLSLSLSLSVSVCVCVSLCLLSVVVAVVGNIREDGWSEHHLTWQKRDLNLLKVIWLIIWFQWVKM